jgi:exosortase A-associated hydrolase 1
LNERAVTFACKGSELIGIVHVPDGAAQSTGLLILTGGDQYRVGAHRQYVLIGRRLAAAGYPVMRFDDRANGDAEGERYEVELDHFEDTHDDLHAAVERFRAECPGLEKIVLWGLCGAVSTFLISPQLPDPVAGLILVNPWVRTEAGSARTYLKHYYLERLLDPEFWRKLLSGRFSAGASIKSMGTLIGQSRSKNTGTTDRDRPLPDRMANGFQKFTGPTLFILSGDDHTAQEFKDHIAQSQPWRQLMSRPGIARRDLKLADHTFSRREWHRQLEDWTLDFTAAVAHGKTPD